MSSQDPPDPPAKPAASLRHRFLGSTVWTAGSHGFMAVFRLAATAVLARLLDPTDYGLLAMATAFIGVAQQARDFGIGLALVQRDKVTRPVQSQAFTLVLAQGLAIYGICWLLSGPIAVFYGEPRVRGVVRTLALLIPLTAFQVIPLAMLRRELRLKGEAISKTIASLVDVGFTIVLAWMGFGVWALVAGGLINSVVFAAGLAWSYPWLPSLSFSQREGRSLLRYGGGVTLSSLLWYIYSNIDFAIVGRVLGPSALGKYTMAWNLAKMAWGQLWIAVSPMVLPLYVKSRGQAHGMSSALVRLTRGLSMLCFPVLLGLAAVADDAVPLFLGDKWLDCIVPLRLLCVFGVFRTAAVLLSPTLFAAGRLGTEIRFNLICALLLPPAFYLATSWGLPGVAGVWAVLYPLLILLLLLPPVLHISGTAPGVYLRAIGKPTLAALLMGLATWALGLFISASAPVVLCIQLLAGLTLYGALLRLLEGPGLAGRLRAVLGDMRIGVRA